MTTIDELAARLEAIEQRLAPSPLAVPPVTVGELADVPAPGSPIASAWAQEVSARITHRFATVAAAAASNLPANGVALIGGSRVFLRTATAGVAADFILIAGRMPRVLLGRAAPQIITNGTPTALGFDLEFTDVDGLHDGAFPTRIGCGAFPGRWRFDWSIGWDLNGAGVRNLWLVKSTGSTRIGQSDQVGSAATGSTMSTSQEVVLNTGEYCELIAFQSSGGNLNAITSNSWHTFGAQYVGPS